MNRWEAIRVIVNSLRGDEWLVHANGAISRESFACADRLENFYLLGAMGLASSVGLGLALSQPQRRVLVLDGDGNLLMGLGNLPLIGARQPRNLSHLVLDNRVYGTTGNQPTLSAEISLAEVARSCGYRTSGVVESEADLRAWLIEMAAEPGPHFLQVRVTTAVSGNYPRIPYTARQIKERFLESRR